MNTYFSFLRSLNFLGIIRIWNTDLVWKRNSECAKHLRSHGREFEPSRLTLRGLSKRLGLLWRWSTLSKPLEMSFIFGRVHTLQIHFLNFDTSRNFPRIS